VDNLGDIFSGLLLIGFPLLVVVICVLLYRKIRRGSGSATILLGATYDLHDADKQQAIEVIVEREAGKKMEEQSSAEPEQDADDPEQSSDELKGDGER